MVVGVSAIPSQLQRRLIFQISRVRDMERELNYLREESENILTIRDSLPNFCPKSTELCLEDEC